MLLASSEIRRQFPVITGLLAAMIILPLFSCSKTAETAEKDRFPLITNAEEIGLASQKAGHRMLVLDMAAEWCMPCKLLEPTLHEISKEFKGKAVFYRVDVDKSREFAASFGAQGIPFVLFFKNGKTVYSLTGLNPKENYTKVLGMCSDTTNTDECAALLKEKMQN
jgi:thioredoxin 1